MGNLLPLAGDALEPLRRARQAADECELPLMMHIAFGPPTIEEVLPFLKPGDVLTHCFTGHAMKIVDDEGRLLDVARRAWDSGVVFDVGHGTGSFSFETAEAVMAAGRKPDVISTDLHQLSVNGPAFDLPTTLSKFLHLGMSLREVIERGDRAARPRCSGSTTRSARCGRARAPTSRCSGSTRAASRCRTSTGNVRDARAAAAQHGDVRRRPASSSGCRLPPRRRGPRSRSGRTSRTRSPRSSGSCTSWDARRTRWRPPPGRAPLAELAYEDRPLADLLDLGGRAALVTGAAQGFGFACARRLAEAGAAVLLTDRRADRVEAAAGRLAEHGDRVAFAVGDVSVRDEVDALVDDAVERFGRLDVLVNNAAAYSNVRIDEMPLDTFANVLDVNVNGAFWCARQAARQMLEQGDGGAIVNVTSIDALHPTSKGCRTTRPRSTRSGV